MTFNKEPLKTLREWVTRFLENDLMPNEAEIIQQVILGREIQDHPDCVDMSNVQGWYTMSQLGTQNRDTYVAVKACYQMTSKKISMPEDKTWLDFIVNRLIQP